MVENGAEIYNLVNNTSNGVLVPAELTDLSDSNRQKLPETFVSPAIFTVFLSCSVSDGLSFCLRLSRTVTLLDITNLLTLIGN